MNAKKADSIHEPAPDERRRMFSIESANESLVLVRKVVADVVEDYGELSRLRAARQHLAFASDSPAELDRLRIQIEQKVDRLKQLHRELVDVGCELKDFAGGLVDFPALLDGREVLLCWKPGEPEIAHWHELHGGFAGRTPIDEDFRRRLTSDREVETPQET